jgi:hypothetical protein
MKAKEQEIKYQPKFNYDFVSGTYQTFDSYSLLALTTK